MIQTVTVGDVMTKEVVSLDKEQCLPLAEELMSFCHIRHLPVLEHGRLVGIVTRNDVLAAQRAVLERGDAEASEEVPIEVPVAKIMTSRVDTVSPREPVSDVISRIVDLDHRCMPVVDQGKLVGIVTEVDFLQLAKQLIEEEETPEVATASVGRPAAETTVSGEVSTAARAQRWILGTNTLIVALMVLCAVLGLVVLTRTVQDTSRRMAGRTETSFSIESRTAKFEPLAANGQAGDSEQQELVVTAGEPSGDSTATAAIAEDGSMTARSETRRSDVRRTSITAKARPKPIATELEKRGAGAASAEDEQDAASRRERADEGAPWAAERDGEADQRRRLWMPEPIRGVGTPGAGRPW